jgi:hypothetical protein
MTHRPAFQQLTSKSTVQARVLACFAMSVASISSDALAAPWPRLNHSGPSQCAQALKIATLEYRSESFSVDAFSKIPGVSSVLALNPGRPGTLDGAIFEQILFGRNGVSGIIYWERQPTFGKRIVLRESTEKFTGKTHDLFVIASNAPAEEVLTELRTFSHESPFQQLMEESLVPPYIFRDQRAARTWFINRGDYFDFLPDWEVSVAGPDGIKLRCKVLFRPAVKKASDLLPKPVQVLAHLLDQTLGPGNNEGMLHATFRLRALAGQNWANVAMRPWISGRAYGAYNSRAQVDAELASWAKQGSSYRKVYRAIQRQYPLAVDALAEHYQKRFHRPGPESKKLAAYLMNYAFRANYVFHSDEQSDERKEPKSPWRTRALAPAFYICLQRSIPSSKSGRSSRHCCQR